MKKVALVAENTPVKDLVLAALSDRLSIELDEYTPDSLSSIILDDLNFTIYIAKEIDKDIERIAIMRSVAPSFILVADREIPGFPADLFVPIDHFTETDLIAKSLKDIRSFIETGDVILPQLTARQRQILQIHCLLLPEKEAREKAGVCRRTYFSILEELKLVFNVPSTHELRQLFCLSRIPN